MGVSSLLLCKGCTPWQGLLLSAFLLICCHSPTTAKVTIESVPLNVFEGDNVLLHVHNLPENLQAFAWFKGVTNMKRGIVLYELNNNSSVPGPLHSGREKLHRNGSLWISNVTHEDTGLYSLRTINKNGRIVSITTIHLYVHTSPFFCGPPPTSAQLTIESVPPSVAEGASVLLLVHNLPENLRSLFWYRGVIGLNNLEVARHITAKNSSVPGPAHSGRETLYSNGSLLLRNVTRKDTRFYTLRTLSRDLKIELAHVQLHVDASLSTCCNPLTSAQLIMESVPRHAAEGQRVLLLAHNLPDDARTFSWYKGVYDFPVFKIAEYSRAMNSITRGPAHSGRETLYPTGSLLLRKVTEKDSGLYTFQVLNKDLKIETAHVQLHVYSTGHYQRIPCNHPIHQAPPTGDSLRERTDASQEGHGVTKSMAQPSQEDGVSL